MYADLHVHSQFSDGALTLAELADEALHHRVSLLAVADHDEVRGSLMIAPLLRERGIGYVPAVEHTCLHGGRLYHVLGYGSDLTDQGLLSVVGRSRRALDGMSDVLIGRMAAAGERVSAANYEAFVRDPRVGGWKGIEYLWRIGLADTIQQAQAFYARYGVSYADADFPDMGRLIAAIHAAGGRAVLAHPGEMIDKTDQDLFCEALVALMDTGLDGVECYYPRHEPWLTDACLVLCEARGLMITAGSDCHGSFGKTRVGEMNVPVDKLRMQRR